MQSPITFSSSHLSSQLCNQFNPVSLYLGEGVFGEGMEIEDEDPTLEPCHEATTITFQHNTTQPLSKSSPCPTHTVQITLSHARIFTHRDDTLSISHYTILSSTNTVHITALIRLQKA